MLEQNQFCGAKADWKVGRGVSPGYGGVLDTAQQFQQDRKSRKGICVPEGFALVAHDVAVEHPCTCRGNGASGSCGCSSSFARAE